jgi:hypothetical protein
MGLIAHYEAYKSRLWIAGFILVAVHQGRYFQLIITTDHLRSLLRPLEWLGR